MNRTLRCIIAILFCTAAFWTSSASAFTSEDVENALDEAKTYLYAQQNSEGTWEEAAAPNPDGAPQARAGGQWGGTTALVTYALLAAGESPHDERLVRAIDFLKRADIRGTYAVAMRMQVWLLLPQTPEIRGLMRRDAQHLLSLVKTEGSARGHFDYIARGPGGPYSHSRSQYGVLGIWAAAQAGMEIPPRFWHEVAQAWIRHQHPSGGWTYQAIDETQHPLTQGMTAAGVATMFIALEYIAAAEGPATRNSLQPAIWDSIDRGLNWVSQHFHLVATDERYPRDFPYATLYAVERIGVASGLKYFNDIDWYERGARWLIDAQHPDGYFRVGGDRWIGDLANTSFAILFLVKGRAPVIFNKLDYSAADRPANWNQRPRDLANLTRWIGRGLERDLNWQIVTLAAPYDDLHDAPILYLSGNQDLRLDDEAKQKLRTFVEDGGLILGHADGGSAAFANSFRRLGVELFSGYEFRELPADHIIYTNQFQREQWRAKPSVLGLSNGARELMLLIPQGDPSRLWQLNQTGREEFWQLAMNIVLYAVDGRFLRYRDEKFLVERDESISPSKSIHVARLEYPGNWNPEPGGWRRLASIMHNEHKVDLQVEVARIDGDALKDVKVAHLTGTTAFRLDEQQRSALRQFVEGGGTLIIDSAGGTADFAQSAEAELREIFPGATMQRPDQQVLNTGGSLGEVHYRAFAHRNLGAITVPRIQAMQIDGREAVFFSREDLSVGLVGQPVDGILGYDPATATNLMTRLLLHAAGR